jgi:hypothetical protein
VQVIDLPFLEPQKECSAANLSSLAAGMATQMALHNTRCCTEEVVSLSREASTVSSVCDCQLGLRFTILFIIRRSHLLGMMPTYSLQWYMIASHPILMKSVTSCFWTSVLL